MHDKDPNGLVLATAVMAASIIHDKDASGLTLVTTVTVAPLGW